MLIDELINEVQRVEEEFVHIHKTQPNLTIYIDVEYHHEIMVELNERPRRVELSVYRFYNEGTILGYDFHIVIRKPSYYKQSANHPPFKVYVEEKK
jgi:hypothetical protein